MKKNIPIKKTLKSMFMMAFISASLLNAVSVQAAYHIANADYYDSGVAGYLNKDAAYEDINNHEKKMIPEDSQISKASGVKIFLNGKEVTSQFTDGILKYNGNTYLPLSNFSRLLNADVKWDATTKVAEVKINDQIIGIPSQHKLAVTNRSYTDRNGNVRYNQSEFDVELIKSSNGTVAPSLNQNGRIYLPMRFICELFGYNVDWEQKHPQTNTETIEIYQGERPALELNTQHVNETKWRPVGVTVGTEEQWEKFYTQKHPVTGATPINGLYYMQSSPKGNVFVPVFDHNGDGRIGNTELLDSDSNGNFILKNNTVSIEEFKTLSDSDKAAKDKQECINWYRNSVINTKPTTPGKTDLEKTPDTLWGWVSSLAKWVASSGINNKGQSEVWQADTYRILTNGEDFIK